MPKYYSQQIQKSGAAIGTVICVAKPATWSSGTDDWQISSRYPGFLECDGSALNPNQYYALYQVIGTAYGGSVTGSYPNYSGTFNLPNYRGRYVCGTGVVDGNATSSPGLSPSIPPATSTGTASINVPGSRGGQYVINDVRQLNPSQDDTFDIGTFRTSGFDTAISDVGANISGNITQTIGPLKQAGIFQAAPHTHSLTHSRRVNSSTAGSTADGGPGPVNDKIPVWQALTDQTIVTYNRVVQGATGTSAATGTASISGGAVTNVNIGSGGSGYTIAPSIIFSDPPAGGSSPIASVNISGGGSVISVTISFGGGGYTSAPTVTFTDPGVSQPLRKHTHKLSIVGPISATWGHDDFGGNLGQQSASYSPGATAAADLSNSVTKVIPLSQAGIEMNQGNFVMSPSSRTLFDARLSMNLTSAETLPMMQPYHRNKYLIKAI